MPSTGHREHFDNWSRTYDRSVEASESYPFAGYEQVLERIVRLCEPRPGQRLLDVGIGTGNLAVRLAAFDVELSGIDFSSEMLEQCRAKLPDARLVQADLLQGLPHGLSDRFDRIVSGYVLHEFEDAIKLRLIEDLADHLADGGYILIGDIAFATKAELEECRRTWQSKWDETEHYWVAESIEPDLEKRGFAVEYEQVSFCGGVFSLHRVAVS